MMYMCKQIKKENIVTMYDERVAELEHLLEKAHADHAGVMRIYENFLEHSQIASIGIRWRGSDERHF